MENNAYCVYTFTETNTYCVYTCMEKKTYCAYIFCYMYGEQ